jgi:glycerol-3-phosphate O-acyltransferase
VLPRRAADDAALFDLQALKHPLYRILRKIERIGEHVESCGRRAAGRIVYASNHRSHIDYLVEPLVLDDNGIRPPIIAAGINLFGGPLGLLHRTSRARCRSAATPGPAYLITLKAYVAELLRSTTSSSIRKAGAATAAR